MIGRTAPVVILAALLTGTGDLVSAQASREPIKWRFDLNPRPSLRIGSDIRLDFRVKLQLDWRTFDPEPDDPPDAAEIEAGRVGVEGELTRFVEFEIERELADEEDPWRGVWLNVRPISAVQLRAGRFKVPFSRSRLEGPTDLDFVMRPSGVQVIAPGYDRGAALHGRILDRHVNYTAGYFAGDRDAAGEDTYLGDAWMAPEGLWAARVTVRPLSHRKESAWSSLDIGINATHSQISEGRNNLEVEAEFGRPFFDTVYVRGSRWRYGFDGAMTAGPVGFQAEYIRAADERLRQGVADDDLPPLHLAEWYAQGAWVLFGGSAVTKSRPRRPLFRGGAGAIEVAGRFERFVVESASRGDEPALHNPRAAHVAGNAETVWTIGINWYPNRWVKFQFNSMRERFDDGLRSLSPPETTFWSHVFRLQFVL